MPYKCSVPFCTSNKSEGTEYVSVFRFPLNQPDLLEKWVRAIGRVNFTPTKYSCICIKHFNDDDIITHLTKKEMLTDRRRPKLSYGAVPKLYPCHPAIFIPARTLTPESNDDLNKELNENNITNGTENTDEQQEYNDDPDYIGNFHELQAYCSENTICSDLNWQHVCTDESICYFIVNTVDRPVLELSLKIFKNLTVRVWRYSLVVRRSILKDILGNNCKCKRYSVLEKLLRELGTPGNLDYLYATLDQRKNDKTINESENEIEFPIPTKTESTETNLTGISSVQIMQSDQILPRIPLIKSIVKVEVSDVTNNGMDDF